MLVCIHSGRVRRFAFILAILACVLALAGPSARAQTTPQVPAGGSASFPYTSYTDTTVANPWQIFLNNKIIASTSGANGWNVTYSASAGFTVSAPSTATVATGYQVYSSTPSSLGIAHPRFTATFTVVATGQIQPVLTAFTAAPTTLLPGATCTLNVMLNEGTSNAAVINLTSSDSVALPVPAQLTVSAGKYTASATLTVGTPTISKYVTVTATYNQLTLSATVYVMLPFTPNDGPAPGWALDVVPSNGSAASGDGPSSADDVNLASGVYENQPPIDIVARNPVGPDATFGRMYRSKNAAIGYGSPGLPIGWTHNYDLVVTGNPATGPMTLKYPNGATELWSVPTEAATGTYSVSPPVGAPYLVSGQYTYAGTSKLFSSGWQSFTMTLADESQCTFTPSPVTNTYLLTQITNIVGRSILLNYDTQARLASITDDAHLINPNTPANVLLYLGYGGATNFLAGVTDQTDPNSVNWLTVAYTYDANSNLYQVSQEALNGGTGIRWQYSYNTINGFTFPLLTNVGAPNQTHNGATVLTNSILYDLNGRVTKIVDADSNQRTYTYAGSTQVQAMDSLNNLSEQWTQIFDTLNRDTGAVDANGNSMSVSYTDTNNLFQPTTVVNRNNQTSSLTYDPQFGNLLSATIPSTGGTLLTSFSYDYSVFKAGRLSSAQVGSKAPTGFTYYANNTVVTVNNVAITQPNGMISQMTSPLPGTPGATETTTYVYTALGNILTMTAPGPNGHTVTYTSSYTDGGKTEALGEPTSVTDPLGHKTQFQYATNRGDVTAVIDAIGRTTSYQYNDFHQVTLVTLPPLPPNTVSRTVVYSYQFEGGPLQEAAYYDETGTLQRSVSYTAGSEGETTEQTGSVDQEQVAFDPSFRPKTLTDALQNVSKQSYDLLGNAKQFSFPMAGTVKQNPSFDTSQASYDPDQNLNKFIDGNNNAFQFTLDPGDSLVTALTYPTGTLLTTNYTYDEYQRVIERTDNAGTYYFAYDDLDNLTETRTIYTGQPEMDVSYTYNPDGSRQSMTTPAGTYNYSYDDAGNLLSVSFPWGQTVSYGYDAANRLQHQYQSQVTTTYTLDVLDELTDLKDSSTAAGTPVLAEYSAMTYDLSGNRTGMTTTVKGMTLGGVNYNLSGSSAWSYNEAGKEDQLASEGIYFTPPSFFGYSDVSTTYQSDGADNLTVLRGGGVTYNADNQFPFAYGYDGNGTPQFYYTANVNGQLTSFNLAGLQAGYRDDGLRAWKELSYIPYSNGKRTYFLYDGTRVIYSTGPEALKYGYGATGLVQSVNGIYSNPLGECSYLFDPMGNVVSRIFLSGSSAGQMYDLAAYDAFGALVAYVNPGGTNGSFPNGNEPLVLPPDPLGYGGEWGNYTDLESGLVLMGYRYYSPVQGRFLTRDPIGYEGGINPYAYCRNNPIMNADPSGLQTTVNLLSPEKQQQLFRAAEYVKGAFRFI